MTDTERREFLKTSLASLAATTGVAGCKRSREIEMTCYKPVTLSDETALKRAELVKRLEKLAKSKPPKDLVGADCYSMALPIIKEMPCPACGQTMIVGEKDEILRQYNVPLKRIQDQRVDATLIIPDHCAGCGIGLKEKKFQLEIKYPDSREPVRCELDDAFDLELMVLFLHGKDRFDKWAWIGGGGQEAPLKDKVDRLRELFGLNE